MLVVQTGESASQAKAFKAHAVPQGLRENLINALKLLANQQKDGDSPMQSVATGLCERSRKGTMEGFTNSLKMDNHCALEVGSSEGRNKVFQGTKAKVRRESPEVFNQGRPRGADAQS